MKNRLTKFFTVFLIYAYRKTGYGGSSAYSFHTAHNGSIIFRHKLFNPIFDKTVISGQIYQSRTNAYKR